MRIFSITSLLLIGCAHVGVSESPSAWREGLTAHFVVHSDLSEAEARDAAESLEQMYAMLDTFSEAATHGTHSETVEVVVFAKRDDFLQVAPRAWARGFFTRDQEGDPLLVCEGPMNPTVRRRLRHELTHRFVSRAISAPPHWLNEGLALYYETVRVTDGYAVLGEFPEGHPFPFDQSPSLDDLLGAGAQTFYDPARIDAFYAASWALVHFLENSSEDLNRRFGAYVHELTDGADAKTAWSHQFGALDLAERFRAYVAAIARDPTVRTRRIAYATIVPSRIRFRALPEIEHLLLATRIRQWNADGLSRSSRDVERAVAYDRKSRDVRYWAARVSWRQGHRANAEPALRRLIAERKRDVRFHRALFQLSLIDELAKPPEKRTFEQLAIDVQPFSRLARSAADLNTIAWYYAMRQQPNLGLPFARRALEKEPGSFEYLDTLALLLSQKGEYAAAFATQQRAVNLIPDGRTVPEMLERLRNYQQLGAHSKP